MPLGWKRGKGSLQVDAAPLLLGPGGSQPSLADRLRPLLESTRLAACSAALLVASVGNTLMFKKMTSAMPNYGWYLTQLSSVVYVPIFAMISISSGEGAAMIRPDKSLVHKFAVMGLFDSLSGVLMVLGGVHTSGTLQVLLQQGTIPITMIFTSLIAGKRYHLLQSVGAGVIVAGIAMAKLWDSGQGGEADADVAVFNMIFFMAVVPSALSNVFKEVAFADYEGDLDINVLQVWVAVFQVMTNFLAMPIYSLSFLGPQQVPLEKMLDLSVEGTRCLFFLEDQIVDECGRISERPCDSCSDAWVAVAGYIAFNLLFNIFTMLVIKHGSAALYSLIATLRMPLSSVAFSSALLMGAQAVSPSLSTYASLVVILGGLGAYRLGGRLQEQNREAKEPSEFASPMPSPNTSSRWETPETSRARLGSADGSAARRRAWRFRPLFTTGMPTAGLQPAHVLVRAAKAKPRSADRVRRDLYMRLGAASPMHSPQLRHMSPASPPKRSAGASAFEGGCEGEPEPELTVEVY